MKPTHIIAGLLCAAAGIVFIVGGERLTLWSYCRFSHLTGEGSISVGELHLKVPKNWCPIGSSESVTLTSVPASRIDVPIVALVGPLPEYVKARLPQLPERTEILGEQLILVGEGALRRDVSGLRAFRMQYRRGDIDSMAESYVAWLFPDQNLMVSSFRVPPSKQGFFDSFVAELVDE